MTDHVAQRRFLALLEGGLLPLISLTCLHFFIKYGEIDNTEDDTSREEVIEEDTVTDEFVEPQPIEPETIDPIKPDISKVATPPIVKPKRGSSSISEKMKIIQRNGNKLK